MSVRSERRRDKVSGKVREYWMVHVVIQLPDGQLVQARKALSKTKVNKREAEAYERRLRGGDAQSVRGEAKGGPHTQTVLADVPRMGEGRAAQGERHPLEGVDLPGAPGARVRLQAARSDR